MAVLAVARDLTRSVGARPLFEGLSFEVQEGERIGLLGPNGCGKSTLLRIIIGSERPDHGEVALMRGLRVGLLTQADGFAPDDRAVDLVAAALVGIGHDPHDAELAAEVELRKAGMADPTSCIRTLSGGWRKRVAVLCELVREPQLLLLDEPTNHLDLEGVLWLESVLARPAFAFVLVSHDRAFLEAVANRVMEINPRFPDGHFRSTGGYSDFLEARAQAIAGLESRQAVLANQVAREVEWLRRSPKAQMKRAQSRVATAEARQDELAEVSWRNRQGRAANIDFSATGRQSADLVVGQGLQIDIAGRTLVRSLDLELGPGTRLGLLGRNGSGKSTLLRVLSGELAPAAGRLKLANALRTVYFRQDRASLDPRRTLRSTLCPNGDTVFFRESRIHVMAWAKRFCFRPEQMDQEVGQLSGGEHARLLISHLMQQPADLLLLDEPTNDLDIATLEVLEDSILSFPGAVVLVTHDRFLLDRVSTRLIALDGAGGWSHHADYWQWQQAQQEDIARAQPAAPPVRGAQRGASLGAAGLSKSERRELERMEEKIAQAEEAVAQLCARMSLPAVASDAEALLALHIEREKADQVVERLYQRWQELEEKAQG
jgi:ATP-binding cassette subfamily F protein uup